MIELPPRWTLPELRERAGAGAVVWAGARGAAFAAKALPFPVVPMDAPLNADVDTIVAIGGGAFLDAAKLRAWRMESRRRVVAVPTLWGSGAEASPIAIERAAGARQVVVDDGLVPRAVVYVAEFLQSVDAQRALSACADAWVHAVEGFASPLANDDARGDTAELMARMLHLPLGVDVEWFECSAMACVAQARASVGLVHGMAHALEDALLLAGRTEWHHARLVRAFFAPVLFLNRRSPSWAARFAHHGVDLGAVESVAQELFVKDDYAALVPEVAAAWGRILRDPATRTNAVLLRAGDLAHFEQWGSS